MRIVGSAKSGWVVVAMLAAAMGQACDSGSNAALFGAPGGDGGASQGGSAGAGPSGANDGGGAANAGSTAAGASAGSTSAGATSAGSTNGGGENGGSSQGGASQGGAADPNGGAPEQPGEGGMASVMGGAPPSGEAGEGGAPGTPGEAGQGGMAEGGGPSGPICDEAQVTVQVHVPNVMFVIDRSGTMFDPSNQPWADVKEAALTAIEELEDDLAIGFLAVSGESASCPLLDEVAPTIGNHAAITAKYDSLTKPTKGESPFMLGLTRAGELLDSGPGDGEAYTVMVIDGEPDYCNDGLALCPIDSLVARIQALRAQGFTTLVAGLPNLTTPAQHAAALQSYANAGVGLPVAPVGDTPTNIYYQCSGTAGWVMELTESGKLPPAVLGTYSNDAGAAPYTSLDPSAGVAGLTASFRNILARTKSCRFDLLDSSVELAQAGSGQVTIDDQIVPYDTDDGWHMVDADQLELSGSACEAWRTAASEISVKFPCEALSR